MEMPKTKRKKGLVVYGDIMIGTNIISDGDSDTKLTTGRTDRKEVMEKMEKILNGNDVVIKGDLIIGDNIGNGEIIESAIGINELDKEIGKICEEILSNTSIECNGNVAIGSNIRTIKK